MDLFLLVFFGLVFLVVLPFGIALFVEWLWPLHERKP